MNVLTTEANALRAVELTMAGLKSDAVAEQMGVSGATVRRWLKTPGARAAIAAAYEEQVRRIAHMAATAGSVAIQTLMQAMRDPDAKWSDRIRAADVVMRAVGTNQAIESIHDLAAQEGEIRRDLADRLGRMAEQARSVVIEANAVEGSVDAEDPPETPENNTERGLRSIEGGV